MNRRSIISLSAMTTLGLALLLGSTFAQQKSLREQLIGTWTVVSWEQTTKDGSKLQRFGTNPKGVNFFDADGHFFIMFARPDLPEIASNNASTMTPEEAKAIASGSIAYFGTYTVDETSKILTLRVESSSRPNQLGIDQKRAITSLTADELTYTNLTAITGSNINIAFKRAK